MREIIFDTETTGLETGRDRVIEFGGVELVNRFPTGRTFHAYFNPQGYPVHPEALAVHGLNDAFLADKPTFAETAAELMAFLEDAVLVAHNANFDLGFMNAELKRISMPLITVDRVIDTLAIAKRKHPMGPNSLDALCRRYGIDNSRRTKHGALLDSELLAEVYIELIGGKQAALVLDVQEAGDDDRDNELVVVHADYRRTRPLQPRLSEAELEAHAALVAKLGEKALWREL
ncbi:MAG: DNA polymerase III subunit epsilon [Mesorhizobium sp.]|nr:DNA polymerase III subunit epsilon [Mesorhizobium sp.]